MNSELEKFIDKCAHSLSESGPFKDMMSNFCARPQQIEMTRQVASAIHNKETLLIEAGTGTGKTFAYLIPALLSNKKIIISTGTRYLQDQLFNKDIPILRKALEKDVDIVVLKGRSNYLCHERFEHCWHQPDLNIPQRQLINKMQTWMQKTKTGDISDFKQLGEDSRLWKTVTSTIENCLGSKCPHYDQCFVYRARKKAIRSDIVIVNHYLLLADLSLKDEGFGQLLPTVDTVIVDEAHQLDEIASYFFSEGIGNHDIRNLLQDMKNVDEIRSMPDFHEVTDASLKALNDVKQRLKEYPERGHTQAPFENQAFVDAYTTLQTALTRLYDLLGAECEHHERIEHFYERTSEALDKLHHVLTQDNNMISWYEWSHDTFLFHLSHTETAEQLKQKYQLYHANWIFTSATLSVNDSFDYIRNKLGVEKDSNCISLGPVFDFQKQAALYIPPNLPNPNSPEHTQCFVEESMELLKYIQGNALFLFTSYRALYQAAEKISSLKDWTVFVQGDAPKLNLVNSFRQHSQCVLLGTMGFWEGLDMQGTRLRCVFIDKLPFAQPNEPLVEGRRRRIEEQGGNFFIDHVLPAVVVCLRQGVGRLIRDVNDKGIVVIGDPRIINKSYGKIFLRSLPKMPIYRTQDKTIPYLQ